MTKRTSKGRTSFWLILNRPASYEYMKARWAEIDGADSWDMYLDNLEANTNWFMSSENRVGGRCGH